MRIRDVAFEDRYIPEPMSGCWLWLGAWDKDGYGKATTPDRRYIRAHRWSYERSNGPIPLRLSVLHRCDTPSCVNPKHLFVGTQRDNATDMVKKGRQYKGVDTRMHPRGEDHPNSKLTLLALVEIQAMLQQGLKHREIAVIHGVSRSAVTKINQGQNWRRIEN